MQFRERQLNGVTIVDVEGRLTLNDPPGLLREVVVRLIAAGRTAIVLNLRKLGFADSACIGELVCCHLAAEMAGATVKIAAVPPQVAELLRMTHLHTLFERYDSDDVAVSSFSAPVA